MITKTDLIKIIAEEENLATKEVTQIINKALAIIVQKVSEGEKISIKNFGTFLISNRAEHVGHNPRTGEPITIAAHKIPYFRAGDTFKKIVNR